MIRRRAVPADGAEPAFELVELGSDEVSVELSGLGAAIRSVVVPDAAGRPSSVHLHLTDPAEHRDRHRNPHLGATVGRYANRIAGASFPLDGRRVDLVANNGANTLHGGPDGFDRRVWAVRDADDGVDGAAVTFDLVSPDGDQGFPGQVRASATYELSGDELTITCTATTDAPTVVNLTNHGYWNLDGAGPGGWGAVRDHELVLACSTVLPVDADGIPTGVPEPVTGTPFDLRTSTVLGPAMDAAGGGFDHCFGVDGTVGDVRPVAVLRSPSTGRWMSVHSDQVGVQLYTGNGLGDPFAPHTAVSLETQAFPDTPNRPELGSVRLDPHARYETVTVLRFGVGEPPPA
ncbi:MAG: aldose epimerase family protein [Microthrixaceae bacterium]